MGRPHRQIALFLVFLTTVSRADPSPWTITGWHLEEFQPKIKPGGRANTIAIHPKPNENLILVASESGGLFRSDDSGNKWKHVDGLPVFYTNAVAFVPGKPDIIIVTASEDFSISNRGGIWRSDDGGKSWAQVPSPPALSPWSTDRFSAYEISIAPDTGNIYVATSYGISIGDPDGNLQSWKHVDPFGAGRPRAVSVLALPKTALGKNLVLAGGPAGIARSSDGGMNWVPVPAAQGPDLAIKDNVIQDIHAFGRSPVSKDQAYVVAPAQLTESEQNAENLTCSKPGLCTFMVLYFTDNGGNSWQRSYIAPADTCRPAGGCAGGIGLVKAVGDAASFDLYLSNRLLIYRLPHGGVWGPLVLFPDTSEAGDTRDIAFNSQNQPILAATDGGVIKPPDGGSARWTFAGDNGEGNSANGFAALQIYEVKGQWIGQTRHDIYFGTQDNSLWSRSDTGNAPWTRCCNEGGFIGAQYHVATAADSEITFSTGSNWKLPSPLFSCASADSTCTGSETAWKLLDCDLCGLPTLVRKNFHVQGVDLVEKYLPNPDLTLTKKLVWSKGLAVTHDFSGTLKWRQYAKIKYDRRDLPKPSSSEPPAPSTARLRLPALYQAVAKGGWDAGKGEITQLVRIDKKPFAPDADVTEPKMANFGGIGIGPTMNPNYRVFDVDPSDVKHLIAADVIDESMKETWDGGESWTLMPLLTGLVTDGSKLNFSGRVFISPFPSDVSPVSQASAISFYPDNPNLVAVGTVQSGIFISNDSGKDQTWTKVPGSERATLISALHWRKADDIIVSTYGRGLWRLRFNYLVPIGGFGCKSPDCFPVYVQHPPEERPSPFQEAILALGGRIEGARIADGILEEVFIGPDTSIGLVLDSGELPDIKVTETARPVSFLGIENVPRPPKGAPVIIGLMLQRIRGGVELAGFLFGPRPITLYQPESKGRNEPKPARRKEAPAQGHPYLELLTGPDTVPGAAIRLAGRDFEARSAIAIAVDGRPVGRRTVEESGTFSASIQAPSEFGLHSMTIIDGATGKVITGAMVMVRPKDEQAPVTRGVHGHTR
jgi:hypothetical protein